MLTVCMLVHRRRTTAPRMQTSKRDEDKEREEGVQTICFYGSKPLPGKRYHLRRPGPVRYIYTPGPHMVRIRYPWAGAKSTEGVSGWSPFKEQANEPARRRAVGSKSASGAQQQGGERAGCTWVARSQPPEDSPHMLIVCIVCFFAGPTEGQSKREKEKNPNNKTP